MKISIALCTFNGQRFLAEQLASIAGQDCLPAELVVCDDGSTDQTVPLLRDLAARAPFPVHLHVNQRNLGVAGNFEKAVGLCRGDLIFLSDQDDVWMPDKLRRLEAVFRSDQRVAFCFTDALAVDPCGRSLDYRLWEAVPFPPRDRRRAARGRLFDVLLKRNVVTGATMAFRASYREMILPIPSFCQHDAWIAILLSTAARSVAVDETLIHYRQHPAQQLGERPRNLYQQYLVAKRQTAADFQLVAERHAAAACRLRQFAGRWDTADAAAELDRKAEHFRTRARIRGSAWRWPLAVRELFRGNYGRYALGWKSLAQDLIL